MLGHKSVIMVYLSGGTAHQDTFDLKPNAPAEVRGEFKPARTAVPGVQFGEHVPLLAKSMDTLVVVRSLVGRRDEHSSWQSYTVTTKDAAKREQKPHFGSAAGEARDDPVPYPSVLVTVYKNLGIDPHAMVTDVSNRPAPVLPGTVSALDRA